MVKDVGISGVDALVHAIESYLSKDASVATEPLSIRSIELISGGLKTTYDHGDDLDARETVQLGATMATVWLKTEGDTADIDLIRPSDKEEGDDIAPTPWRSTATRRTNSRPPPQHTGPWRHRLKNRRIIDVEITSHP